MKIRLIEQGETAEKNREIPISQDEFLIGRGTDCDLRLPVSSISRHHCLIRVSSDEAAVIDLGSSNGTFLNGQRVRSQATLHHGDELQVGECRFRVALGEQDQGTLAAPGAADPFVTTMKIDKGPAGKKGPKKGDPGSP